jgi:hypothetical protein
MLEWDFPPLDSRDSPKVALQLNPEVQASYATTLRKPPPVALLLSLPNTCPDTPANPHLPFPAGWRIKINKVRNNYWYIKRVEREWFCHDPNLDGIESDE